MSVTERLKTLNITLPNPSAPAANYVPYVVSGKQIFISGQVPLVNGSVEGHTGIVGKDITVEQAKTIARICGLNIIAQVAAATEGKLDHVRCVKLGVFVNSISEFTQQPEVANGASDLMVDVFGEKGKHARFAVSAPALPRGVAVEVDAIFEII